MKLGTIIQLEDGRIGTICWRHLDGEGGVWGEHDFSSVTEYFSDDLPAPEFMLREKDIEPLFQQQSQFHTCHRPDIECVGEHDYEVVSVLEDTLP